MRLNANAIQIASRIFVNYCEQKAEQRMRQ